MQYLLLLYGDEKAGENASPEEIGKMMAAYGAFTQEVIAAGVMKGGEALMPTSTATTVRVRDGKSVTTDGPFAETKEQLGGFYLLECKDLDQALSFAAKIPAALDGCVEVRPVMDVTGM